MSVLHFTLSDSLEIEIVKGIQTLRKGWKKRHLKCQVTGKSYSAGTYITPACPTYLDRETEKVASAC